MRRMKMAHSISFTITIVVVMFAASLYSFVVPLIQRTIYDMESRSGRTILNNVYELIEKSYKDQQILFDSLIESRKAEVKNLVTATVDQMMKEYKSFISLGVPPEKAKSMAIEHLRGVRFRGNNYFWAVDYASGEVFHPDPNTNGKNYKDILDVKGARFVSVMVQIAVDKGEGYHSYWWKRLNSTSPVQKMSYFVNVPELKFVIGAGVYEDDIHADMENGRKRILDDLKTHILAITLAKTGYMYIFDANAEMIVHPNKNIAGTNISKLKNPQSGKLLYKDLEGVADNPDGLLYVWDKPDDPGNYVYEKISWVRHFKPFEWYIASSIYMDELNSGAVAVRNRIIEVAAIMLLAAAMFGYVFVKRITGPLNALAHAAKKAREGDLSVSVTVVEGGDEISELSRAFHDMLGQLRGYIGSLDEKVRQRTTELEKANEELKKLDKLKSDFISSISHELRTPMTSLVGFSKIMRKKLEEIILPIIDKNNAKAVRTMDQVIGNLEIIVLESERLTNLINDVMDMARLESGEITCRMEPVNVNDVVTKALDATQSLLVGKDISLRTELCEDEPATLGDIDRLTQVVVNLVSNAIKFTPAGYVTISTARENGEAFIRVADTGIGIPPEDMDKIFDKFKQVGDTLTDKPQGAGLGLAICSRITALHNGRIRAQSEPGKGSVFTIALPLH